jgi:dynein heavy chain
LDRELLNTYGDNWITEAIFQPNYQFNTIVTSENGVHY